MGAVILVGHKSEALCIKSGMHLQYDNPADMEQTTESSTRKEV